MFQRTPDEKAEVIANCDHPQKLKFSKALPFAFTEFGAIQASNVLATQQAGEMGIYVVRAFVRLGELEQKTEGVELSHDTFSRSSSWCVN